MSETLCLCCGESYRYICPNMVDGRHTILFAAEVATLVADNHPSPAMVKLAVAVLSGSQNDVIATYAETIRTWPEGQLMHGSFWHSINEGITERWSESALKRMKREAWRIVDAA